MIDPLPVCPIVPNPVCGTVGQGGKERDTQRDNGGTNSLKHLAAAVLARDSGRDKPGTRAAISVPQTFPHVPPGPAAVPPPLRAFPGVPAAWCEGVVGLAALAAPDTITPVRWAALAATSTRLLRDHGAALHAAGWDALDLFGLHATAPATNPPGWGLAWLLGSTGEVLDVAPEVIGLRRGPDGARLAYRRGCAAARARMVPAWVLDGRGPAATCCHVRWHSR